jgi:C-terminal processing protease CtpA/Prc
MKTFSLCKTRTKTIILVFLALSACTPQNSVNNLTNPMTAQNPYSDFRVWLFDSTNVTWNNEVRDREIRDFVYACMRDMYYWNDKVPKNIVPSTYPTPEAVLEATRYKQEDHTSYLLRDGMAYIRSLQNAESTSYGLSVKFAAPGDMRIAMVLSGSPAEKAGLRRGMRINRVNGIVLRDFVGISGFSPLYYPTLTLEYDSLGSLQTTTMQMATFNSKTVPKHFVINHGGKKVGYMLFTRFTASSAPELDSAFGLFASENISELVLDLRYNSGGFLHIAQQLGSLIAAQLEGTIFYKQAYNERYRPFAAMLPFVPRPNSLRLKRLFVIMTENTGSASETIINGLKPHIDVVMIGSKSFGKNTSFFSQVYHPKSNYIILIVNGISQNSLGESDFSGGFVPTRFEVDDVTRDFGHPQERCFAAALSFIANGTFPALSQKEKAQLQESTKYKLIRDEPIEGMPLLVTSTPKTLK